MPATRNLIASILKIEPKHCMIAMRDRQGRLCGLFTYSPAGEYTLEGMYRAANAGTPYFPRYDGSNPCFSLTAPTGDQRSDERRLELYLRARLDQMTVEQLVTRQEQSRPQVEWLAQRADQPDWLSEYDQSAQRNHDPR